MAEGELVPVTGESESIHAATFSPDGRWLALVSDRTGNFEMLPARSLMSRRRSR